MTDESHPARIKIAVLLSGSGTTLQNLIDHTVAGSLKADICVVMGSRPSLLGLQRARDAKLNTVVCDRKNFSDLSSFSRDVFSHLDAFEVDLVCLAGWLCLLEVPEKYAGRILNIHPALLPSFGGRGMYGQKVHQAVIDHGCKVSGCTVHFVDQAYDTGPIVLQRTCPVLQDDSATTLAARVFAEEKIAYPQAIELFRQGRLHLRGRRVVID